MAGVRRMPGRANTKQNPAPVSVAPAGRKSQAQRTGAEVSFNMMRSLPLAGGQGGTEHPKQIPLRGHGGKC